MVKIIPDDSVKRYNRNNYYNNVVRSQMTIENNNPNDNNIQIQNFLKNLKMSNNNSLVPSVWVEFVDDTISVYVLNDTRIAEPRSYSSVIELNSKEYEKYKKYPTITEDIIKTKQFNFTRYFLTVDRNNNIIESGSEPLSKIVIYKCMMFQHVSIKKIIQDEKFIQNFPSPIDALDLETSVMSQINSLTSGLLTKNVKSKQTDTKQTKQTPISFHSLESDDLEYFDDKEIDITKDNTPFTPQKWEGIMGVHSFSPSKLIGDSQYRSINSVKQKAEASLLSHDKNYDENDLERIASDVVYKNLENCSSGNPSEKVEIQSNIDAEIKGAGIRGSEDSKTLLKMLSTNPTEIYSPIVLLNMKDINWSMDSLSNNSAKDNLNELIGPDENFKNGLISYPMTSNEELIDSSVMVKNRDGKYIRIGISTKSGFNGVGANASLSSLFKMLFKDYIEKRVSSKTSNFIYNLLLERKSLIGILPELLNSYGLSLLKKYQGGVDNEKLISLGFIVLIGGTSLANHPAICNLIIEKNIGNLGIKNSDNPVLDVVNAINTKYGKSLTEIVMEILDKQKYKFIQMNCKPILSGNSLSYEYSAQYPARFRGNVKLERAKDSIKFHIYGSF